MTCVWSFPLSRRFDCLRVLMYPVPLLLLLLFTILTAGGDTGVLGKALLEDDEAKSFVRKYAGNSKVR